MNDSLRPNVVTDQQRDRAVDYLQQAYAKGVLDADVFEERLAQALTASTRSELNSSLRGVARVAHTSSSSLAPAPVALPQVPQNVQNIGAGLVHLLGIPTGFIGPAIVKAASPKGSRLWWEAGRAMAWHFSALMAFIAITVASLVFGLELPVLLGFLGWLLTSAVFSARAFNGSDSTGRLGRVLMFRPQLRK